MDKKEMKDVKGKRIELSEETADFLVLYRDTNVLYNRIYETMKKHAPDPNDEKGVNESYTPFAEPAKQTLSAIMKIIERQIEWGLIYPEDTTV